MSLHATMQPVVDVVLIGIWGYVLYLLLQIADEGYGGTLTAAYPYLVGGFGLFFLMMVVEPFQQYIIPGADPSTTFVFGLQIVQIVAGVMLAQGTIKMYNLTYATDGFHTAEVTD